MNREKEEALANFVAEQHRQFNAGQWLLSPHPTGATPLDLATVAYFLAQTTFGHEVPRPAWFAQKKELLDTAKKLDPTKTGDLPTLVDLTGFTPDRFAHMVDAAVALNPVPTARPRFD